MNIPNPDSSEMKATMDLTKKFYTISDERGGVTKENIDSIMQAVGSMHGHHLEGSVRYDNGDDISRPFVSLQIVEDKTDER